MKIKAKNSKIASMKLCVPLDGVIDIDKDGMADVSAKCAILLVNGTNDWEYAKKPVNEESKDVKDENSSETLENGEEENDDSKFESFLDGLTVAQMKDYAKDANLPKEEYDKISSKKLMKAYLLKKYSEAEN